MTQHGTYRIDPCTCGAEIGTRLAEMLAAYVGGIADRLDAIEGRLDRIESVDSRPMANRTADVPVAERESPALPAGNAQTSAEGDYFECTIGHEAPLTPEQRDWQS